MQDHETIISGVRPPKRKKKIAAIAVMVLLAAIAGATTYFFASGKGDGFAQKGLAIAVNSWDEVLGYSSQVPLATDISLNSHDAGSEDFASTTSDFQDGPADQSVLSAREAHSKQRTSKRVSVGSSTLSDVRGDGSVESLASPFSPTSSSSLDAVTIVDPISVADAATISSSPAAASASSSSVAKLPLCSFFGITSEAITPRIILNEIAWMGSASSTSAATGDSANHEWIELKNTTQSAVSMNGWQVADASGTIDVSFGSSDVLPPNGLYLLSRDGNSVAGIPANKAYVGGLSNSGELLAVFDAGCGVSDFLDATAGWPGGDNATKQTLERKVNGIGWQTSFSPGGTPGTENSVGALQIASGTVSSSSVLYSVEVTMVGDGAGKVTAMPNGISCSTSGASSCTASYPSGTILALTATPGANATFGGWTGPCSGSGSCSFSVGGSISVMAQFHAIPSSLTYYDSSPVSESPADGVSSSTDPAASSSFVSSSTSSQKTSLSGVQASSSFSVSAPDHIVIAEVQIAGASSSNDFIKLYNPTAASIDMSAWKLHKKSSTGTDYSLRDFPKGTTIASGGYFIWANSLNGFSQMINADASSTEALSADNSIALMNENGTVLDALAWGTGTNQYGIGPPYPTDPEANQMLVRKISGGVFVDTSNNAQDFTLQ